MLLTTFLPPLRETCQSVCSSSYALSDQGFEHRRSLRCEQPLPLSHLGLAQETLLEGTVGQGLADTRLAERYQVVLPTLVITRHTKAARRRKYGNPIWQSTRKARQGKAPHASTSTGNHGMSHKLQRHTCLVWLGPYQEHWYLRRIASVHRGQEGTERSRGKTRLYIGRSCPLRVHSRRVRWGRRPIGQIPKDAGVRRGDRTETGCSAAGPVVAEQVSMVCLLLLYLQDAAAGHLPRELATAFWEAVVSEPIGTQYARHE